MRKLECGKYENQTFNHFLFRIPHSDFHIHLPLTSAIYCDDVSFSGSIRTSSDGGVEVSGGGGGCEGGVAVSVGMACKPGSGLAACGLFGDSLTGYPFSSSNSPLRVNTYTDAVSNFSGNLGDRVESLMVLK